MSSEEWKGGGNFFFKVVTINLQVSGVDIDLEPP
jgi:hypothetical protein